MSREMSPDSYALALFNHELFSHPNGPTFDHFLRHVDSFLQRVTLNVTHAHPTMIAHLARFRELPDAFCHRRSGVATAGDPLVLDMPAIDVPVKMLRNSDLILTPPRHDDPAARIVFGGASATAGPACIPLGYHHVHGTLQPSWPSVELGEAPSKSIPPLLRLDNLLLHGQSGACFSVWLRQETNYRAPAAESGPPTTVVWSVHFQRENEFLELAQTHLSGARSDAPTFIVHLRYSFEFSTRSFQVSRHSFLDELFGGSDNSPGFLTFVHHVDDFLQQFTLGVTPLTAPHSPGSSTLAGHRYRELPHFDVQVGDASGPSPLRLHLPALELAVRQVVRYGGYRKHREIALEPKAASSHLLRAAGPACLQTFREESLQTGPVKHYEWPTEALQEALRAHPAHATARVTFIDGQPLVLQGRCGRTYEVWVTQHEAVKDFAALYSPPPTSVTWDVHITPARTHVHDGPHFFLELRYVLPDQVDLSAPAGSPFAPEARSRSKGDGLNTARTGSSSESNLHVDAQRQALQRANRLFEGRFDPHA